MEDMPLAGPAPFGRFYRFQILFWVSAMFIGNYFAYDSVGAIETDLMRAFSTDRAAIGAMYSVYSIAAVFAVVAAGLLTDRLGTRAASLLFTALLTAGAAVVAAAPNLATLYAGRILFGMGAESQTVVQGAMLARWFTGKELALSFGVVLTVSRLGTLFSFNSMALLAARQGYRGALWTAAALCLASLAANLVYVWLDRRAERPLGLREEGAGDRIVASDIRRLPASFWYIALLCVTFYSAIFPFTALSTDLFHDKYGLPQASGEGMGFFAGVFYNLTHLFSTAQGTTSIVITASMFFAPFAGSLVDRFGRRASLMLLGSLLLIPAHLAIGLTNIAPALPMILLGAAFVLVPAALWPAVPLVVAPARVGTAFGLMTAIQNVGLLIFPYVNGQLRDATHGYAASQVVFASLGVAGLILAWLLLRADRRAGHPLERARPV
jgi:MFS family permease